MDSVRLAIHCDAIADAGDAAAYLDIDSAVAGLAHVYKQHQMRIIVMYDVDLQKRNDILLSSDGQGLDNRLHQQNIVINNIAYTYRPIA